MTTERREEPSATWEMPTSSSGNTVTQSSAICKYITTGEGSNNTMLYVSNKIFKADQIFSTIRNSLTANFPNCTFKTFTN